MRNRLVRAGANLLLLCSAVVFSLLLAELGLRLFYPQKLRMRFDAYASVPGTPYYGLRPNYSRHIADRINPYTFATNSYGIRDVEFDPTEPHPRRVIFLGDSFTQGVLVDLDETFVKRFERHMEAATGRDWQALNLAVAGGSTFDAIYAYRTKGMPLAHRYVVLGFYMNDISDNLAFQSRPLYGENPEEVTLEQRVRRFVAFNSHLWNLFAERLHSPLLYRLGARQDQGWFLPYLHRGETNDVRRAWALTLSGLDELNKLVRSRNAQLILLVIPMKVQLSREVLKRTLTAHGYKAEEVDDLVQIDRPQRKLETFASRAGIPIIDLLVFFGQPDTDRRGRSFYFSTDPHFNEHGHAATGDILARTFLERCGSRC